VRDEEGGRREGEGRRGEREREEKREEKKNVCIIIYKRLPHNSTSACDSPDQDLVLAAHLESEILGVFWR